MTPEKIVVLPHVGELGWFVLHHLRWFNQHPASSKIAVCEPSQRCMFPSATGFYEYSNPIPDNKRCGDGGWGVAYVEKDLDAELTPILRERYPDHEIIRGGSHYGELGDLLEYKFSLPVDAALPRCDVVLGVRQREMATDCNYEHWEQIGTLLGSVGLTVGLAGARESSKDIQADAKAWDHPAGETAGTLDLLQRCRLYVGGDSGLSHLAAFLDVPTLLLRYPPRDGLPDQTWRVERANKRFYERLDDSAWHIPDEVLGAVIRCLYNVADLPQRP